MPSKPDIQVTQSDKGAPLYSINGGTPRPFALSFTYLGKSGYSRTEIDNFLKSAMKKAQDERQAAK